MRHAMQSKEVPPLETVPVKPESDEEEVEEKEESSDDYEPEKLPEKDRKRKEKKPPKRPAMASHGWLKKIKRRKKEPEPVKPKHKSNAPKKLNTQDIDEIMAKVANLPDDEPIMVMQAGKANIIYRQSSIISYMKLIYNFRRFTNRL